MVSFTRRALGDTPDNPDQPVEIHQCEDKDMSTQMHNQAQGVALLEIEAKA